MIGTVDEIHIYPVKSCRRVALDRAEVVATGLAGDRMWQVVDSDGKPVTQRQHPVLATVQPEVIDGGLRLTVPRHDAVELPDPSRNDVTVMSMLGIPVEAADGGDITADWVSALLGDAYRLAGITEATDYHLPPEIDRSSQRLAFVDAAPVLVANGASLRWLQDRASAPFDMTRFRPNLSLDIDEPWIEDTWRNFSVGAAELTMVVPWPRCTVPQIDQETAARHKEPAKVLKAHRWCTSAAVLDEPLRSLIEGNSLFGVGCTVGPVGTEIVQGDPVTIKSTAPRVLAPPEADPAPV